MRCMTAIWPAGPPKLNIATRSHTRMASRRTTPCCGFQRSVIASSAKARLTHCETLHSLVHRNCRLLAAFLPEILVEVVEHCGAPGNPLRIIVGRSTDPLDQRSDAVDFGSAKLAVFQIDIVDDLGDRAQRRVFDAGALEQHLE